LKPTGRTSKGYTTHDLNFYDVVEDMFIKAFENALHNLRPYRRPKGTGKDKKSPAQNGAASIACLLSFICLESRIRNSYYFSKNSQKDKAHSEELWWVIKKIKPTVNNDKWVSEYLDELNLVRDIIAHAYLFSSSLTWNEEHQLVVLKEKVVSGVKCKSYLKKTKILGLHSAPNQIGFFDAAKFFVATKLIIDYLALGFEDLLWPWNGNDLEPIPWLNNACKKLHETKSQVWQELLNKNEEIQYSRVWGSVTLNE